LDWFSKSPINGVAPCSRVEDITSYQNALSKALLARWLKLSEMTGCMPLCAVRSFTFVEKTSEDADWARNWSSAFYLDVKTSSYIHQTEFYAYDVGELASGLGGFMGIFLGWSFLSMMAKIYEGMEEMAVRMWAQKLVKPIDNGVKVAPS